METFGRKLGEAMRHHGLHLEDVARATGLDIGHIQALLRDDFSALPDDDVVRRGLQSFAWLVEVDPDQVIADFRQERQRTAKQAVVEAPKPRARRAAGIAVPALAILAITAAAFLFWPRASAPPRSGPSPAAAQVRAPVKAPVQEPVKSVAPPPDAPARPAVPRESAPVIKPPIGSSGASVPEHGVGRGIVDHDLVGETRRFTEGERVWFWTRIQGGTAGETIHHVWIHDGVEALRVPVRLGGARWRAHSYKILNAGSAGSWAVEARDRAGRVLARREFSCSPGRNGP